MQALSVRASVHDAGHKNECVAACVQACSYKLAAI